MSFTAKHSTGRAGRDRCPAGRQGDQGGGWQEADVSTTSWSGTGERVSLCGSDVSYFFSTDRECDDRLRGGLPLLPAISFCGLGGVLSARWIAASRRRAVSSGLYWSDSPVIRIIIWAKSHAGKISNRKGVAFSAAAPGCQRNIYSPIGYGISFRAPLMIPILWAQRMRAHTGSSHSRGIPAPKRFAPFAGHAIRDGLALSTMPQKL
jgi:hypothetical protein